jgi:uncharacterized protein (TIGR02231 family)
MDSELQTTVEVVTVYPERALILRRGTASIDTAGEQTLRIGGLPHTLIRTSLRATGRGPAGTHILGIEQASEVHAAPPEETLRRLRGEIDRLQRDLSLLAERDQIVEEQREWLRTLGEQSARSLARGIAGLAGSTAKPEDAGALFAYTSAEAERLAAARQEIAQRRVETQRELEARQRELNELGGGWRPDRVAASVRVEVPEAGQVEILLSYLVTGASWRPRYDARVDREAARVGLSQQALVSQQSGEDWRGVALALSTAQPAAAVTLPDEPDPWYIDVPPPQPVPVGAAMPAPRMTMARRAAPMAASGAYAMINGVEEAAPPAPVEAEQARAEIERSGAAQVYHVPGGVDVPSDGQPHTLGLSDDGLPCRFDYVAAPAIASGAHLRALATNATGRVLLPGELHVFHAGAAGDEYVGATRLELTAEDAELKLYLGVDDNVTVKRELVERETEKGNILQSDMRRITFGYRVTLGNRTSAPQRVTLKDRLPVPRHERIKLRVLDMRPQPTTRTKLDQLAWEMQLAPGEERRVEWRFVVEAPADLGVVGLP